MKRSIVVEIVVLVVGSLLAAVGCGPDDPGGAAASGLSVTVAEQSEMALMVKAAHDGAAVAFSVRRLGLREADFVRDPEVDSPYDADLTARNRHGYPFLASGNHGPNGDATAGELADEPLVAPDHEEQVADLQLVVEAVEQLRGDAVVGERFRWELRSLHYLAAGALERADDALVGKVAAEAAATEATASVPGKAVQGYAASGAASGPYTHRVSIRYTSCCVALGHHSAVLLEVFDSVGTFVGAVSTRNHGRDASDPSMQVATGCPRSWSGRNAAFPNFRPYYATDADWNGVWGDGGGCETPYGFTPGRHVCNDDSQAQYWNVKHNIAGTWPTCSDWSLRWWSPFCD